MADQYVQYSRQGYFSRIGGAIKGVVFGVILFFISFVLLFWNEKRAVDRELALKEGGRAVVHVDSASVSPANDGKLVHFNGNAAGQTLSDADFGITRDAVHLRRNVKMYQWKEEKKTETHRNAVGGGESKETTYTYPTVWSDRLIRTNDFEGPGHMDGRHDNPESMPYQDKTYDATAKVGAYTLPDGLAGKINNYEVVPVDDSAVSNLTDRLRDGAVTRQNMLYLPAKAGRKADPGHPEIGDLQVQFFVVPPGPVTVMAKQAGSTLEPYATRTGELYELHTGTEAAAELIKREQGKNTTLTWILRVVGFVVMWIGLAVALSPLKVLADVIGILGDLVGMGIFLATGLLAFILSLLTIAVAWIAFRPLLGVGLLVVAGAAAVLLNVLRRKRSAQRMAGLPPVPGGVGTLPPLPRG